MSSTLTVADQIRQLNDARKLVLGDVSYYPSVVRGILPIIGPSAPVELRRWGAEFLAEAFATPALPNGEKETMQPYVLDTIVALIENEKEDAQVLRSVIQTAASIYPLAMRWIINNAYDTVTWEKMTRVKERIFRMWDATPPTVKICCIKFAQRLVLAQTVASGAEPRHGGALDVSLDKVPAGHQTLDPRKLEPEAVGVLDRVLDSLQTSSDVLIVDATLNCLSILVRTRPDVSNRVLGALLNFNPLKLATSPMTSKTRVVVRSMEKTSRMLLLHLSKRDPHHPLVPRIQHHIERMMRAAAEVFEDGGKKRPLETPQHDGMDAKRQRIANRPLQIPPLGPPPHSLADVFCLIGDRGLVNNGLRNFDVSQVPAPLVAKVVVSSLSRTDPQIFAKAIEAVRARLEELAKAPAPEINPNTAMLGVEEDEDDYEPDFSQAEDTEQILNKLDSAPAPMEPIIADDSLGLGAFNLPNPQPMTIDLALSAGGATISRVLEMVKTSEEPSAKRTKTSFARLAASSGNKDAWTTILARLATRSSTGLEVGTIKDEDDPTVAASLSQGIRDVLYNYIMEDFRRHIDTAVSWLCEEWYNDKMQQKMGGQRPLHYSGCAIRLIDGFLPYLHPQDKVLTRFLSEIPELDREILSRVKSMCRDPSVVQLALTSLLYLVMMRPPIREVALDTVQDIWTEFEDARTMAGKYLSKYRPAFLEAANRASTDDATSAPAIAA